MGVLYVVATPIGNLEDITLRALRILREVRLIAAEDTRHTRKLLTHFQIGTPAISYHQYNKLARLDDVLAALALGDVALVSDAGTPAISDPGQELVRATLGAGYRVVPVPGPAAAITALVASGLSTDRFTFLGFLPRRPTDRRAALLEIREVAHTLVLYEAPHRLRSCLDDLLTVLGNRPAALARELTKVHEEIVRGNLGDLRQRYATEPEPRGEYTLVIAGKVAGESVPVEADGAAADRARARLRALLRDGLRTREAADVVAAELALPRRDAYRPAPAVAAEQAEADH
ncbi:MAG: 16S rRNA (cytidine(1402)-2'-O)-methyltransferase [Ktedonobacterales bacterium]